MEYPVPRHGTDTRFPRELAYIVTLPKPKADTQRAIVERVSRVAIVFSIRQGGSLKRV